MDLDEGVKISPNPPDPAGGPVSFNSTAQPGKKLGQTEKQIMLEGKIPLPEVGKPRLHYGVAYPWVVVSKALEMSSLSM